MKYTPQIIDDNTIGVYDEYGEVIRKYDITYKSMPTASKVPTVEEIYQDMGSITRSEAATIKRFIVLHIGYRFY